jgi:hypothetical protein
LHEIGQLLPLEDVQKRHLMVTPNNGRLDLAGTRRLTSS